MPSGGLFPGRLPESAVLPHHAPPLRRFGVMLWRIGDNHVIKPAGLGNVPVPVPVAGAG